MDNSYLETIVNVKWAFLLGNVSFLRWIAPMTTFPSAASSAQKAKIIHNHLTKNIIINIKKLDFTRDKQEKKNVHNN